MFDNLLLGVILSLSLGALIGSQREIKKQQNKLYDFAGFRTFTFISLLGYMLGFISKEILKNYYIILIGLIGI